jgi:hypothetical protein
LLRSRAARRRRILKNIENLGSSSKEEEEEIEIPKSRNSSRRTIHVALLEDNGL